MRRKSIQRIFLIGVFKQNSARKRFHIMISVKRGDASHDGFGQQQRVHGVNFAVVNVIRSAFQ